jgi:periplasmic divalent cation tolerance protein
MNYRVVLTTLGSHEDAVTLAGKLVEEQLVACANVLPGATSVYTWQGETCTDPEVVVLMKTRTDLIEALEQRLRQIHPYEVPEFIALEVTHGLPDYLAWIERVTRTPADSS